MSSKSVVDETKELIRENGGNDIVDKINTLHVEVERYLNVDTKPTDEDNQIVASKIREIMSLLEDGLRLIHKK